MFRRRETTNPVPAKVFLKVSPGIAMLFSQPACAQEEKQLTQCQPRSFKGEPRCGHAVSQPICAQEERNDPPSANQGLSKGVPRHGHAVFSTRLCTGGNGSLSANQGLLKVSLASFPGRIGETAWQLPRVQTVYGCNVMVIAIFHSTV